MKLKIRNEDCRKTMEHMINKNIKVDLVVTSPPYNIDNKGHSKKSFKNRDQKYKYYNDNKTREEYLNLLIDCFNQFDKILNEDKIVVMNLSYCSDRVGALKNSASSMLQNVAAIIEETPFMVADILSWKKPTALPLNTSKNKVTRYCEQVFIFCRKTEFETYDSTKEVISTSKVGQNFYSGLSNFIEAKNNDGKNPYNNATYSTEFVMEILKMYCKSNYRVYDPFGGIGTTAKAVKEFGKGCSCIYSELDPEQVAYAKEYFK